MKSVSIAIVVVLFLLALTGCAPGVNSLEDSPNSDGIVAGFWRGVWNGLIAPVTFVVSLFNRNVQMYEVHNNGGWYDFGFLLGVMIIFGGSGGGARGASGRRSRQ